ncbi:MAG: alpha/beta hydrolase fold domain-containing protein [Deltaproteobacteria bacterium]|nr:alpha/beta hydrolase fold domain-containing protein [Deltaproteobacteria bacterium]
MILRHKQIVSFICLMCSGVACSTLTTGGFEKLGYVVRENVTYREGDDFELKLNIARPAKGRGPFPGIVFLFGGGYKVGNKSNWNFVIREAAKRGYVAAAIDYRLTDATDNGKPKYTFPSQIHDAKCAVRWLRARAWKYRLDKDRIGVVGFSAGGNLALMLGLTHSSNGLEGNCGNPKISSRVQAVINLAGGTDLALHYDIYPYDYGDLLGGTPDERPERFHAASPLTYVSSDDPPVLTICGREDPVYMQELLLDRTMKEVGASHTLVVREGVGHLRSQLVNFAEDNVAWEFLDEQLKHGQE